MSVVVIFSLFLHPEPYNAKTLKPPPCCTLGMTPCVGKMLVLMTGDPEIRKLKKKNDVALTRHEY